MKKLITISILIFSGISITAQDWQEIRKIYDPANDGIGSVSIDGNIAIVGAPNDDNDSGLVYIYYNNYGPQNRWDLVKSIKPEQPVEGSEFGAAVDISGDYIIGDRLFTWFRVTLIRIKIDWANLFRFQENMLWLEREVLPDGQCYCINSLLQRINGTL